MPVPEQIVLPFAVKSESRKEPFSSEAEVAAIFTLSELERKNSGLNSKQEKSAYVLKVGYPLWLIVRDCSTYVFDGLNRTSHSWMYYEAQQTEFMIEDFETNFRIREKYVKFLVSYQDSFQQTLNSKELSCEGLIADSTFLGELNSYRKEATRAYGQSIGLLLPALKETEAMAIVSQIESLQLIFREKTEKLKELTGLISKTTKGYVEGFNFESKAVTEEAEAKIKAQKEIINPKVEKLSKEYKKQVERLEKSISKEKELVEKQKSRIGKTLKEKEVNIMRYSKQVKVHAQKGNKRSESSLKKKIKKEKQELDELQKQYKKVEKQLEALAEQKASEATKLKREFDEKVQVERQPIVALEVLRDERQEFFKQESLKLEEVTQPVLEELDKLVVQREKLLTGMEQLSVESIPELKNNAVMYVPFYIAAYDRSDLDAKRYFVFSPALVSSLGFSSKLKGALGMAKIKDLLNERFKAVSSLGEKLRLEAASNSELKTQIETLAQKNSILYMKTPLKDGLCLLKEEGWLSKSDYQAVLTAFNANELTF